VVIGKNNAISVFSRVCVPANERDLVHFLIDDDDDEDERGEYVLSSK
jgi:hypothetical protein